MKKLRVGIILLFIVLFSIVGDSQKVYNNLDSSGHIFKDIANFSKDTFKGQTNFGLNDYRHYSDFSNSIFNTVDFSFTVFENKVTFLQAKFDSVDFSYDTLRSDANFYGDTLIYGCFSGASFNDFANFNSIFFKGTSVFYGVTFKNSAFFSQTTFKKSCSFDSSIFYNIADFSNSTFNNVSFSTDTFKGITDFSKATFRGEANFSQTTFLNRIDFENAIFSKPLNLSGIDIDNDDALFWFFYTHLPDTIDLSYDSYINNDINLTVASLPDIKPKKRCSIMEYIRPYDTSDYRYAPFIYINLYNSDISKIKMDYIHFRLYFRDTYSDEDTTKKSDSLGKDQITSIYELLLKNFKDGGQDESYKNLNIEYRYFKENYSISCYFEDWWWRFGYEKERIFKHTLLFILLFTIINFFFLDKLNEAYEITFITNSLKNVGSFNIKRLWYSLLYTSTLFFPLTLKRENIHRTSGWLAYIAFIYLLGLICVAYMANFVLAK